MRKLRLYRLSLLALVLLVTPLWAADLPSDPGLTHTETRVQKALKKLPYYGVFDNIAFQVDNGVVTLSGKVRRASLKSEAQAAVLRLEEVKSVNNEIEILPLSNFDDQIRLAALRQIYSNPMLSRYAAGVHPAIRIIVERGKITLEGVVRTKTHSRVAEVEARTVPGAFEVENHLKWEKS